MLPSSGAVGVSRQNAGGGSVWTDQGGAQNRRYRVWLSAPKLLANRVHIIEPLAQVIVPSKTQQTEYVALIAGFRSTLKFARNAD